MSKEKDKLPSVDFGKVALTEIEDAFKQYVSGMAELVAELPDVAEYVPVIKEIIGAGKLFVGIRGYLNYRKTVAFMDRLREKQLSEAEIEKINHQYQDRDSSYNKLIEDVVVYLDKVNHEDKAKWLADIFLANVNGTITYDDLGVYFDIVERVNISDIKELMGCSEIIELSVAKGCRLQALGLLSSLTTVSGSSVVTGSFSITDQGQMFIELINDN